MTISEIIKRVRVVIDDAAVTTDSFTTETDAALTEFVKLALELLAARDGVEAKPTTLTSTAAVSYLSRNDGLYYAAIAVPDNYVRFVSVKLSEWKMPQYDLLPTSSPLYALQNSYAKGVANGPKMPVAFITRDRERRILAHALKTSSGASYELKYIPALEIGSDGSIPLADRYSGALTYYAAALYHESVNESALAKEEMAIAQSMIISESEKSE
jgi:hypothetical protein